MQELIKCDCDFDAFTCSYGRKVKKGQREKFDTGW